MYKITVTSLDYSTYSLTLPYASLAEATRLARAAVTSTTSDWLSITVEQVS